MTDGAAGPFALRVADSALAASAAATAHVAQRGRVLDLEDRSAAEALAARLADGADDPLAVQAAAPNDDRDVDAYLVAAPERRTHDPLEAPAESGGAAPADDDALTFETTGRQYGAIGEALVVGTGRDPPLLSYWIRRELDRGADEPLAVTVDDEPEPVAARPHHGDVGEDGDGDDGGEGGRGGELAAADRTRRWRPDCRAVARAGPDGPVLATYLVEVKTGAGSLLRDQRAVMAAAARRVGVLRVSVDVDGLPDRYTARVRAVDPSESDLELREGPAARATLDEF